MKILVVSDTHGDTDKAEEAIRYNKDSISMIIHLGDYFRDAQKLAEMFPEIPIEYIYGNSDFMIDGVPAEKMLNVCGKRIFMTHGHRYSVSGIMKSCTERQRSFMLTYCFSVIHMYLR